MLCSLIAGLFLMAAQLPTPVEVLQATYPSTDVVSASVTSDGRYGFVAEGGQIIVVDLDNGACQVGIILVDATVRSVFLRGSDVFIAAGTFGVWKAAMPATSCPVPPATLPVTTAFPIDDFITPTTSSGDNWRECIDVTVQEGSSPQLLALFSGHTILGTGLTGSQLRIYPLASGPAATSAVVFNIPVDTSSSVDTQIGFKVIPDSLTNTYAYIAMGTGGILRVCTTCSPLRYKRGPLFEGLTPAMPPGMPFPSGPARVTGLSLTGRYLYAAIDIYGVAEIDVMTSTAWSTSSGYYYRKVPVIGVDNNAYSVSSASDGANILIAVTSNTGQTGPINSYHLDFSLQENCPPVQPSGGTPGGGPYVHYFARTAGTAAGPAPAFATEVTNTSCDCSSCTLVNGLPLRKAGEYASHERWGNAYLAYTTFGFRLAEWHPFASSKGTPPKHFHSFVLGFPFPLPTITNPDPIACITLPAQDAKFSETNSIGPIDATASFLNPDLVLQASESFSPAPAGWLKILGNCPGTSFDPIAGTSGELASDCDMEPVGVKPFGSAIIDGAHWTSGTREWFVVGAQGKLKYQVQGPCSSPMFQVTHQTDCGYQSLQTPYVWDHNTTTGWSLLRLNPFQLNFAGAPPLDLPPSWWQIRSPSDPLYLGLSTNERSRGVNYFSSVYDTRSTGNDLIYFLRSNLPNGLVAMKVQDLTTYVTNLTAGCPAPQPFGLGQVIDLEMLQSSGALKHVSQLTHYEWSALGSCPNPCNGLSGTCYNIPCGSSGNGYTAVGQTDMLTLRGEVADVASASGPLRILALAVGAPTNYCTSDLVWRSKYNKGMVVFYEVGSVDPAMGIAPKPVRLAFCEDLTFSPSPNGQAVAVHMLTLGSGNHLKTYAFVADLGGRVWVYDLSTLIVPPGSETDPSAALQPISALTWPPLGASTPGTVNEWDGSFNNVEDLVVEAASPDVVYAYVANAQGGFTVLTYIGFDTMPGSLPAPSVSRHDTSGDCRGVEFRQCLNGSLTLVVSDSYGGMRLYGR